MEDFCYSFDDQRIRGDLLDKITGRGAFRRFKDVIHFLGIEDEWYRFREDALRRIARDWLEENGIAFE